MSNLPEQTKGMIFTFLFGDLSLCEFETFLYGSKEIENTFKYDDYIELLSLNFSKKSNRYEAFKLIEKNIDMAEYEVWRLHKILNGIVNKEENYPQLIASLYDLYCKGYYFLNILGISFGLNLMSPREYNYDKNISELIKSEQIKLANALYPEIIYHVNLIQNFLKDKKIIVTGKLDDSNNYEYIDNRTEVEKAQTEFRNIENKKSWWQFWKSE
ncbi:hypothetical protein ORQ95_11975 [Leptospira kirschneri]|nr:MULTISPECIES: hypothetical protein [Leptospira]EMO78644.1 hypothetical protein LEP1GSC126_1722 [Leptospira kirschneri str. 200801774]ULG79093.1 hypothetical protein FH595_09775 [Leptospira interrogans]ULG92635.1 hypothetical protein FH584_01505 [Leptospira interrogans]UML73140.1 hypothetical protein FH598_04920 [Leptospira interrogans]UZW35385.1 hypothetical protein ORQ95_11975 [Leptospira kirschneri]